MRGGPGFSMTSMIKGFVRFCVKYDPAWKVLEATLVKAAQFAEWERLKVRPRPLRHEANGSVLVQEAIASIVPDLKVKHGPFRGMVYPTAVSVGSALFPKLLGTYESELHPLLNQLLQRPYTDVVDIGCAEGYYAVGMALRLPGAKVYAFDADNEAMRLCAEMARLNEVSGRVTVGRDCDEQVLRDITFARRALILSDCEGYEKTLFSEELVSCLAGHDVLIEVHDFIDIETSECLVRRFDNTHTVTRFESLDDLKKARTYSVKEIARYTLSERKALLAESRPAIMEWLYFESKAACSG